MTAVLMAETVAGGLKKGCKVKRALKGEKG